MLDIQARGVVVLGSERLQAEARTGATQRNDVVIRNERVGHAAELTRGSREDVPPQAVRADADLRVVAVPIVSGGDPLMSKPITRLATVHNAARIQVL